MKVAVATQSFGEGVEDGVKQKVREFITLLENFGHEVTMVDIDDLKYSVATYYIIAPSEASTISQDLMVSNTVCVSLPIRCVIRTKRPVERDLAMR